MGNSGKEILREKLKKYKNLKRDSRRKDEPTEGNLGFRRQYRGQTNRVQVNRLSEGAHGVETIGSLGTKTQN